MVRSLMEKATSLGKLEEMCNLQDAAGKTPFDMAAAGQHKVSAAGFIKCWVVLALFLTPSSLLTRIREREGVGTHVEKRRKTSESGK